MILYVNTRLNGWAEWVASGKRVVGLGYPSQCSYTRLSGRSDCVGSPEFDEDAWEMEQAVQRLPADLKQLVIVFYLETSSGEQKAKRLHCHRDTMYSRLNRAHNELLGHLNDLASGC